MFQYNNKSPFYLFYMYIYYEGQFGTKVFHQLYLFFAMFVIIEYSNSFTIQF